MGHILTLDLKLRPLRSSENQEVKFVFVINKNLIHDEEHDAILKAD